MPEVDLSQILLQELLDDRDASLEDIRICETAISMGIETYGDGKSVSYRLRVNREIVEMIEAELKRRGVQIIHTHSTTE